MRIRVYKTLLAMATLGAITSAHAAGSISGIVLKPTKTPAVPGSVQIAVVGEAVSLMVQGSGACSQMMVDTGEGAPSMLGSMPQAAYFLPTNGTVSFHTPGLKEVKVQVAAGTPDGCTGVGSAKVQVVAANQFTPYSLSWGRPDDTTKSAGKVGETLAATIEGGGVCADVAIDWGDGAVEHAGQAVFQALRGARFQPGQHAYAKAGTYKIKVWDAGSTNCGGQAIVATVVSPGGPLAVGPGGAAGSQPRPGVTAVQPAAPKR